MDRDFEVSMAGLADANKAIDDWAGAVAVPADVAGRLHVVVDEVCANLLRHDSTIAANGRFSVALRQVPEGIRVRITDSGQPFDPIAATVRNDDLPGGNGLLLIRDLASDLKYERIQGQNRLEFTIISS